MQQVGGGATETVTEAVGFLLYQNHNQPAVSSHMRGGIMAGPSASGSLGCYGLCEICTFWQTGLMVVPQEPSSRELQHSSDKDPKPKPDQPQGAARAWAWGLCRLNAANLSSLSLVAPP